MIRLAVLTGVVFLAGVAAALGVARIAVAAPVVVRVTMADYHFTLSRQRVPVGSVRFVVVNRGATVHDFAIGHAKTRLLQPEAKQTIRQVGTGRRSRTSVIARNV